VLEDPEAREVVRVPGKEQVETEGMAETAER
jgi:hypothetical protein